MRTTIRRRTLGLLSGVSVLVALAACGNADADEPTPAGGASDPAATASTGAGDAGAGAAGAADGTYADGTYTAEGSYSSPGGKESIGVELTVTDDVVTDVTVTPEADSGNAKRFQEEFASGIADEVVGKKLDGLSVDKVSGSSLTGDGFNAALDAIRADAGV